MKTYCLHCNLENKNPQEKFCCKGCGFAYQIINNLGLQSYYQNRLISQQARALRPEEDTTIDLSEFVSDAAENLYSINLMIEGMHCAACVWLIESVLKKQPDVKKARVNMSSKRLYLEWSGAREYGNQLVKLIFNLGYRLIPFDVAFLESSEKKYDSQILKALSVAGFAAGNVMLISVALWANDSAQMGIATRNLLYWVSSLITLPAIVYSGRIFFISAFNAVKAGRMNMDVPIAVAIFLASIISIFETVNKGEHAYFDSVIMLIFFLLIGRYLDFSARKKAFSITTDLVMLSGTSATIIEDGKHKIVASKNLTKDMILSVAMGERIAADGLIIDGKSEVDSSIITGESLPKKMQIGDEIFAGMINLGSALQVRINKASDETLLAKIVKMVEKIESGKSYYTQIADVLAKYYAPIVHLIALATFILWCFLLPIGWHQALLNASAVLIVTCPCALALSVPVAKVVAASKLLKQGILLKNGDALEKLDKIDTIIFDKTGTLTLGKPKLIIDNMVDKKTMQIAVSMATKSNHILSRALVENVKDEQLGFLTHNACAVKENENCYDLLNLEVQEVAGMGLITKYNGEEVRLGNWRHCNGEDALCVIDNQLPQIYLKYQNQISVFNFQDQLRVDACEVIQKLKNNFQNIILLSGDRNCVVEAVAKELGIEEYYFEKTPDQKLKILENLRAKKKNILMVGDGVNDAPSLMLADVSISPSSASDISKNIADIIFQGKKLWPILESINVSKKSNQIIKQNLGFSLLYNLIAVPFAIAGWIVPLFAALAMSSSSIVVVVNAMRIKK